MNFAIQWDKLDTFETDTGESFIRYAVGDRDGITYEFSMHDPTIQAMFPQGYWWPVYCAPTNNVKIDRIDGRLVVLCGLGKPNDPNGNLMLSQVAARPKHSVVWKAQIIAMILATLAGLGISPDKDMYDAIRRN